MIDPLTYLMTLTGWKAWETAAASCLVPVSVFLVSTLILAYLDAMHVRACNKFGYARVMHADPHAELRPAWTQIILGSVIFMLSMYIAGWYSANVPEAVFRDWFSWLGDAWKSAY